MKVYRLSRLAAQLIELGIEESVVERLINTSQLGESAARGSTKWMARKRAEQAASLLRSFMQKQNRANAVLGS